MVRTKLILSDPRTTLCPGLSLRFKSCNLVLTSHSGLVVVEATNPAEAADNRCTSEPSFPFKIPDHVVVSKSN